MNIPPSQSSPAGTAPRVAIGSLFFVLSGFALWVLVSDYLDPPDTWSRCAPPSSSELAELSARREDFLLVALPMLAAYGVFLAVCVRRWTATWLARQGHQRYTTRLALAAAIGLGSLWALLIGSAFSGEKVGAAIFWGTCLAAVSLAAGVALAVAVAGGALRGDSQPGETSETLSVGFAWTLLLVGLPWLLLRVGIAGKDGTIWC